MEGTKRPGRQFSYRGEEERKFAGSLVLRRHEEDCFPFEETLPTIFSLRGFAGYWEIAEQSIVLRIPRALQVVETPKAKKNFMNYRKLKGQYDNRRRRANMCEKKIFTSGVVSS